MKSTISADIIKSTSLSVKDIVLLRAHLVRFQANVKQLFPGSWGRIIRGDGLECVLQKANQSLRAALMLKYLIKSFNAEYSNPAMVFKKYGVRIAVGIGSLRIDDSVHGIIDGYAIYASGRELEKMRANSKGSMSVSCENSEVLPLLRVLFMMMDVLSNKATGRQSAVIYRKLLGVPEVKIAEELHITQPTVNVHAMKAGWAAIDKGLRFFESISL